jgi:hypothetical protein
MTLRLPAGDEKYKVLPHRQPRPACSCPPAKARPRKRPMPGRHPSIMMLNQHERGRQLGNEIFHILAGCDRTRRPEITMCLPFFLIPGCDQTSTRRSSERESAYFPRLEGARPRPIFDAILTVNATSAEWVWPPLLRLIWRHKP